MKNIIQNEKAVKKMNLLKDHILKLAEYNNIENYNNIKEFNNNISYTKFNEEYYMYKIKINRGTNNPEKSLDIRFKTSTKIYDLLENLIMTLTNSKYFSHQSLKKTYESSCFNKFIVNLKKGVTVSIDLNDKEDENFLNNINNKINNNSRIIVNTVDNLNISDEIKDTVQQTKAELIINNVSSIFESLININKIENYNNKKPYKLIVNTDYNENKNCHIVSFKIIRGTANPETILNYSLSIVDENILYNKIYDMLQNYLINEDLLYVGTNTFNKINTYDIYYKNLMLIQIVPNTENDKVFFDSIINEYQNNINKNNTKVLTK